MNETALLIPFACAGLALINAGLTRSRNAAHSMLSALCVPAVAALAWFAVGSAILGHPGGAACRLFAAGKAWDWLGADRPFLSGGDMTNPFALFALMVAAGIPLGAGADRWRLGPSLASAAILGAWTYPLFAHWSSTGWLGSLITDRGGAGSIHTVGGLTALAVGWILGPRRGKYTREGMPTAIPGHNAVLVLSGCFLAWIGFLGLNGAQAAMNTTLSAAASVLAAAAITRARFGKPDASLCANGWVAGLVTASAGGALMPAAGSLLAGAIGGALAIYAVELLELRLSVDDPCGAISVHGVCGIWSLIAAGLFGGNHVVSQLIGVATLLGCILPMTYGLNWVLNRFFPMRVAKEAERQGLDLYELGAGAYPDFMSHTDDSWLR